MTDDSLRNTVLHRADQDADLSEDARLVILAALDDDTDLGQVLGGAHTPAALRTPAPTPSSEPIGAYLKAIAVEGFRGIGTKVTLPLVPGPGLTVIAGRNGSGKSTLAEGLELALTGINSRWKDKAAVWSQNWRNLHAGEPAAIRIVLAEEGAGETTLGVDWAAGADVDMRDQKRWVQRAKQKQQPPDVLGWATPLELYRPLLSYDELSGILEGRPSDFYDQLYKLLGLEQLTVAIDRLSGEVKLLKTPSAEAKSARDALRPLLEGSDDPRAGTAAAQLKKTKPDLDVVRTLVIDSAASSVPPGWREASRLPIPEDDDVTRHCAALRAATDAVAAETNRVDALAADRARILELALAFHGEHGDTPCPVCAVGALDDGWTHRARASLAADRSAATALTAVREAARQARAAAVAMVRAVPPPPATDDGLSHSAAAREAFTAFTALPHDDDDRLIGHVQSTVGAVQESYTALRGEAAARIQDRDDAWGPIALSLAAWLAKAEAAAAVAATLATAVEAHGWLQRNAATLRNERIAPLAEQAKAIWAALRQESNVELEEIRLEGKNTSRRVVLKAGVDGSAGDAFGVMSQGELHALALAVFIPRAKSAASPFRFLVFDDPIQAMDPSKVDGFLDVLNSLAAERQVVVFTHDDRLPAAIRRSRAPARIVELTRTTNSTVSVADSSHPATRMLDDAYAIAADPAVPDKVKKTAIPVLCREAFEATAWDVFAGRALSAGQTHGDVERAWETAATTRNRLALAINPDDITAMDKWLDARHGRRSALSVATTGAHHGVSDFKESVNSVRRATRDLGGIRK